MADEPNYHILLWPEPPGPSTYACLLCPLADVSEAEMLAHVTEVHALSPVPTPMAAAPPLLAETMDLVTIPTDEGRHDG